MIWKRWYIDTSFSCERFLLIMSLAVPSQDAPQPPGPSRWGRRFVTLPEFSNMETLKKVDSFVDDVHLFRLHTGYIGELYSFWTGIVYWLCCCFAAMLWLGAACCCEYTISKIPTPNVFVAVASLSTLISSKWAKKNLYPISFQLYCCIY